MTENLLSCHDSQRHAGTERIYYRGRHRHTLVCDAPLAECHTCRLILASILAEKLGYDLARALDLEAFGNHREAASTEDLAAATDLRRLIVLQCFLHQPNFSGFRRGTTIDELIVADDTPATPGSARAPLRSTPHPTPRVRRFLRFWRGERAA